MCWDCQVVEAPIHRSNRPHLLQIKGMAGKAERMEVQEYWICNHKKLAVPRRGSKAGGNGGFVALPRLWDFAGVFKFNLDPLTPRRSRDQPCFLFVYVC